MRALFPYYSVKRAWHNSIQSGGHTVSDWTRAPTNERTAKQASGRAKEREQEHGTKERQKENKKKYDGTNSKQNKRMGAIISITVWRHMDT